MKNIIARVSYTEKNVNSVKSLFPPFLFPWARREEDKCVPKYPRDIPALLSIDAQPNRSIPQILKNEIKIQ